MFAGASSARQRLASKIVELWRIPPCRGVSARGFPCRFGIGAPKCRVDGLAVGAHPIVDR